jgi:hypothetical protein
MVERRTNVSQFAGVNALQKDIERLTKERDALAKERENSQTKMLEEHGVTLGEMKITLKTLVDSANQLPEVIEGIKERLTKLEKWKIWQSGFAAAWGIMGAGIGFIVTLIFGRH